MALGTVCSKCSNNIICSFSSFQLILLLFFFSFVYWRCSLLLLNLSLLKRKGNLNSISTLFSMQRIVCPPFVFSYPFSLKDSNWPCLGQLLARELESYDWSTSRLHAYLWNQGTCGPFWVVVLHRYKDAWLTKQW